jgi:hypothetical protein
MNGKIIKSILLAGVLLSTLNCVSLTKSETVSKSDSAAVNATTSAAVDESAAETSAAADAAGVVGGETEAQTVAPDALVRDLYKTHGEDIKNNEERILTGKSRRMLDKYFDKTLADFIWKDLTTARDEVGVLDFDPFYNAQEADIKNLVVGPPRISGERATVVVKFQNYDRNETLNYQLVRRNSVWKIADIKYTDGSSLLGYFKEEAAKNSKTANARENFFEGAYQVGETTCTVKPIKMAFEVKWAKGSGTMIFVFDGDAAAGNYTYSSADGGGKGKDAFIFADDTFTTGRFVRADGKEFSVRKIK